MSYQVGNIMKLGGKRAFTVEPEGHAYHIAECEHHYNAVKIAAALNKQESHSRRDAESPEKKETSSASSAPLREK